MLDAGQECRRRVRSGSFVADKPTDPNGPRLSEREIGKVFLLVPKPITLIEAETGRLVLLNPAAEQLFGYTTAEARGLPFETFLPERLRSPFREACETRRHNGQAASAGETESTDLPVLTRSGEERWVEVTSFPSDDLDGAACWFSFLVDITRRRASDEARAQLAAIVESSEDAIVGKTLDGAITSWNAAAERLYGYAPQEAIGHNLSRLVPAERSNEQSDLLGRVKRGEQIAGYDTERVRKDGTRVRVSLSMSPLRDASGSIVGAASIARDVTQQRRALAALQKRETQLAEAQRLAHLGSWEWDLATGQMDWSDEHYRIFGLAPGSSVSFPEAMSCVHPDDRTHLRALLDDVLARHGSYACDVRVLWPNGALRWVHSQGTLANGGTDGATRMVGTAQDITDLKAAEEEQARLNAHIRLLLESTGEGVYGLDGGGRCTFINPAGAALLGYEPAEIVGQPMHTLVHHSFADGTPYPAVDCPIYAAYREGEGVRVDDDVMWRRDGSSLPVAYSSFPIRGERGQSAVVVFRDVTSQQEADATRARLAAIVTSSQDAISATTLDGTVTHWNHGAEVLYGFRAEEVVGTSMDRVVPASRRVELGAVYEKVREGEAVASFETERVRKDGSLVDVSASFSPILDRDGRVVGGAAIAQDITARKKAERMLMHLSLFDPLTGLPNRALLRSRLQHIIQRQTARHRGCAVLLINLDRFKDVNEALGHAAGDALLQEVARRLEAAVSPRDTVARVSGDEFAVVLPGVLHEAEAARRAARVQAALSHTPVQLQQQQIGIAASVGAVLYPEHGQDAEGLLRAANTALMDAKQRQRGQVRFAREQHVANLDDVRLFGELRDALDREELLVHLQPKVSLSTGVVVGAEALMRWSHPRRGLVPPALFIHLAERTGLMQPLTRWVLMRAVDLLDAWSRQGLGLELAVNLSASSLQDATFIDELEEIVQTKNLTPSSLVLEVTESALMNEPTEARAQLERIHARGVQVSIDDFGTGYSSLAYLKDLPVDELKIDGSFVRDMVTDARSCAIVESVIDLGHRLGFRVVAEGAEDAATLDELRRAGCDVVQGYQVCRPLAVEAFGSWLATHHDGSAEHPRL